MWAKAELFGDKEMAEEILNINDQKKIKALGRKVKNFDQEIWNNRCYDIMLTANLLKFTQNKELRKLLYSVKDQVLVEASPYDKIWGIGLKADDDRSNDVNQWKGTNLLGKCLMDLSRYFDRSGWNLED